MSSGGAVIEKIGFYTQTHTDTHTNTQIYIYLYIYIYTYIHIYLYIYLFIEHSGENWWEQNVFCSFTTP